MGYSGRPFFCCCSFQISVEEITAIFVGLIKVFREYLTLIHVRAKRTSSGLVNTLFLSPSMFPAEIFSGHLNLTLIFKITDLRSAIDMFQLKELSTLKVN